MEQIIIAVIGLGAALFASQGFWSWRTERRREKSNDSKLVMGIAYSKIIDLCEKHLANGYVSVKEYHELEHYLYKPYHDKGGNGTIDALFEKVSALDIVPEEHLEEYLKKK